MQKPRQTRARRTWRTPRATTPSPTARSGWRTAPDALARAGGRRRQATSRGRLDAMVPRRSAGSGPFAARPKRSSGTSVVVLGRGLLGHQKRSERSRKAPAALIAVVAGLGAAGAAAWKRRRGESDQATAYVPPSAPADTTTSPAEASRSAGAA
jgi:hypothetical protein